MLWYVKDAYPTGKGFLKDGIKISGKAGQKKLIINGNKIWIGVFIILAN